MYLGWVSMAANPWWHRGMMPLVGMVPDGPWHPQLPQLVPWWCEGYHVVPKDLKVGVSNWSLLVSGWEMEYINSRIYLYHVVTFWFCINILCETLAVWVQFFSVTKVNMGFRLRSSWHGCRIWRATRGGGHCCGRSILTSWYPKISTTKSRLFPKTTA